MPPGVHNLLTLGRLAFITRAPLVSARFALHPLPSGHVRHRLPSIQLRFASSEKSPEKPTASVEGATDISHSTFISSASAGSDFNPTQSPWAGQDRPPDPGKGHLSPTKSHLFKLILPLPTSLSSRSPSTRSTAFLLHPSQPLSHLSRLIAGSLPPSERNVEITYLALTGPEETVETRLRDAGSSGGEGNAEGQEGGPLLTERAEDQGKFQEVSWSSSTDLSDFIKQSCLNERFHINIRNSDPESEKKEGEDEEGREAEEVEKEGLTLEVTVPSFASRTTFLRARLLRLTRELDTMTKQKKAIDLAAHKGAQRLAVGALGIGVVYWIAIIRWNAGWEMMEPVTWATGFGALLCSAAFLVYHNREVSYSSLLDLSVTARQKRMYDQNGLDIEKWTEMVAEAKTLRREIARIASDYDLEWKGELENLARDSQPLEQRLRKAKERSAQQSGKEDGEKNEDEDKDEDDDGHIDIDKTIDEASELAEESKEKAAKDKAAQRKGEGDEKDSNGKKEESKKDDSEKRGEEKAKKIIDQK